jgi:hypothetical protein
MRPFLKWLQSLGTDDYERLENDVTLPLATYRDLLLGRGSLQLVVSVGKEGKLRVRLEHDGNFAIDLNQCESPHSNLDAGE